MINTDRRAASDVLMDALGAVEGATEVVIILEKPDSVVITANCGHKDICWLLDQAKHLTVKELFDVSGE